MKRRDCLALMGASSLLLAGCAGVPAATGTGDLGVVVARSTGTLAIVNTSQRTLLAEVKGLGDLSHASVVFSRDGRYAFVFGRDGALTKVDLLTHRIAGRVSRVAQVLFSDLVGVLCQNGTRCTAGIYQLPGHVVRAVRVRGNLTHNDRINTQRRPCSRLYFLRAARLLRQTRTI